MNHLIFKWKGENFEGEGERYIDSPLPFLAGAISKGYTVPHVQKKHPNEDAMAAIIGGDIHAFVIADAHWGRESSHIGVDFFCQEFQNLQRSEYSDQKVIGLYQKIEKHLKEVHQKKGITSETSFLTAFIFPKEGKVEYWEFGDSFIFWISSEHTQNLSHPQNLWLGPFSQLSSMKATSSKEECLSFGLRYGEFQFPHAGFLILASDGLTQPIYGIDSFTPQDMQAHLSPKINAKEFASILMREALRRDRVYQNTQNRGGEDNISFWVYQWQEESSKGSSLF